MGTARSLDADGRSTVTLTGDCTQRCMMIGTPVSEQGTPLHDLVTLALNSGGSPLPTSYHEHPHGD